MTLPLPVQTKAYIGGPMTGLPRFNYDTFLMVEDALEAAGYIVYNPARIDQIKGINPVDNPQTWQWYMREALRMLLDADQLILLPGWYRSAGARMERQIAYKLSMPVFNLQDVLPDLPVADPWVTTPVSQLPPPVADMDLESVS